jgi:hypothetical protein
MAATYKGILTNNGKALIASAILNNKINYSHIAVGDGNGSVPTPLETRTALVNEKARIALNVVEINPNNTNQIVCEAIIPTNMGGFYIRELGLYAGSTMVVNASYPPTYKPLADEGGAREIALKFVINIQNADVIALYLDDSLIYATREWVKSNYLGKNENAVSASKLKYPRKIAGVDFDGSTDIALPMLGIDQTWKDVIGLRFLDVFYVNPSSKPIQVIISYSYAWGGMVTFKKNGVNDGYIPFNSDSSGQLSFIVPNQTSYKVSSGDGMEVLSWSELS